ncbi:MAG: xylose isomerase [Clostridia bacterium]|jgi:sugar phosphate isomerase/epimerase|nr:xylose isomerase [Clostridia bacterium]
MKLGVLAVLLANKGLEDALKYLSELGVQTVEIGTGGYPGKAHANPSELLRDPKAINDLKELVAKYNMEISALSCHGNPVHPQKEIAEKFHKDFEETVLLAEKLGISRVITFSGCPGDSPNSQYPNWVTCPWPEDFTKILEYQWNEVLIPYWKETVKFARAHGVDKICLEMHPGFCVYNTESLLKLRAAVGDEIGANFDPSHLFWQGIDPVASIRKLGKAIYHFHAKDSKVDEINTAINGVLDTKHYGDEINRSWVFRTVGYGHDYMVWKDIISNLKMVGYDGAISIEHEDSLMSVNDGLKKAISFLKEVIIFEETSGMWWA